LSDDAAWIALGTIAPPGDANVFLLDATGKLVRTDQVGQRWIQQVGVDRNGHVYALCTMPAGRAGDFPTVYGCGKATGMIPPLQGPDRWPQTLFQYGGHSNHTGVTLRDYARGTAVLNGNRVLWLAGDAAKPERQIEFPLGKDGVTVAMVADDSGNVLVGSATTAEHNLFLLSPEKRKPVWSRPVLTEVGEGQPPEKGQYGSPTLPDGRREELPQMNVQVFAPLSLAIHGEGGTDFKSVLRPPRLIAAADYPGWQRWIRSSATMREENYGTRFVPARPTVSVYDGAGKLVRRFGPELFPHPVWVDLRFTGGGKYLLAYPHHWVCRGLAGQAILPADDKASALFILEPETGKIHQVDFPDAIADVAASDGGIVVVACWNGKAYRAGIDELVSKKIPTGIRLNAPALVRISRDGRRTVLASTKGEVRLLDEAGKELWRKDLNQLAKPAPRPWVANARAVPIGPGVWQLPGGRVESDLGGQRVVEAPDGLILIEGHAGLSFDREWAAMKAVGLDPARAKYVLATHEHGDHAPGAYLWRVATGARFICSEEMAYTLQHHAPMCSGYGMHPPTPTDIRIKEDTELDLAGLKVKALRLPGHTYGSMGWFFSKEGKSYVAFGDLIMPNGPLGYAGSINFSGRDVLQSLRKLAALKPDIVLPGHGPYGDPSIYIEEGIKVGVRVGWGKFPPEKPDPYFRLTQKNVRVVAWNIDAASADCGDIDGDGKADIAIVAPDGDGAVVKIFLNKGGRFADQPDQVIRLPGLAAPTKIRLRQLNDDKIADILVGGKSAALLLSEGKWPDYKIVPLPLHDAHQVRLADLDGKGTRQIVVGTRFGGFHLLQLISRGGFGLAPMSLEVRAGYADLQFLDVNGDGRTDLLTSTGKVYLRGPDGRLPSSPSIQLPLPEENDWTFLAVGDFNGDSRPDVALLSYGMKRMRLVLFANTGNVSRPFELKSSADLVLGSSGAKQTLTSVRDAPVVADWNGDGVADLIVGKGQDNQVLILLGGPGGLDLKRSTRIALDYRLHYETGLHVADFNGDGVPDLASFACTSTGVGQNGPMAVYLWLQLQGKR
jgi:glyoxylase-like metal-dependent hydrolase (beta-lactamase superfamily II)